MTFGETDLRVNVYVPATSANLGCGFDVFGLALALYTEFSFDTGVSSQPGLQLEVVGEGAELLRREGCGLVYEAAQFYAQAMDVKLPPFKLTINSQIPLGRGLGSSAAAIVGGLIGAAALTRQENWQSEREMLLRLATEIEGHPDNVAPALMGGLVVAVNRTGTAQDVRPGLAKPIIISLPVPENLATVLFIPDFEMSTKAARAVLPPNIPFGDAVHNMARTGLFAAIFAATAPPLELLAEAMDDRLHQPYRTQIFPQLPKLIASAQAAGAWGAALSGAGSSVLALVDAARAEGVKHALEQTAQALELPGRATQLNIASSGTEATFTR